MPIESKHLNTQKIGNLKIEKLQTEKDSRLLPFTLELVK